MNYIIKTKNNSIYYVTYKGDVNELFEYIQELQHKEKWLKCITYHERKTLLDINRIESIQVMRKGEFNPITQDIVK